MAQMAAMPRGNRLDAQLQTGFMPKQNVLVLPSERIRVREDGVMEVFGRPATQDAEGKVTVATEETWHIPPTELIVHRESDPLDRRHMDFVISVIGLSVNTSLTDSQGHAPAKSRPLVELFRQDATEYLASFGGKLVEEG
jgi:hypothetical protein